MNAKNAQEYFGLEQMIASMHQKKKQSALDKGTGVWGGCLRGEYCEGVQVLT